MKRIILLLAVLAVASEIHCQINCSNMGFENGNFSGWTGSTGTVSVGATRPVYGVTGSSIVNAGGSNVSLLNAGNYHTIMTTAPVNATYPNCVGYDSLACKLFNTTSVSQIPVVNPYSSDGVSVRMNGAIANYRACKLKYITLTSATNRQLSYSYALVLNSGGHAPGESPYFVVEVRNETTNAIISSCSSRTITDIGTPSDSLKLSSIGTAIYYSKWKNYVVDLSGLPLGTSVSVNFEVGGCAQAGHWGYAYVDAECGSGIMKPYVNMCAGFPSADLIAPGGYDNYQWFNTSNAPIAGAFSRTLTINSPVLGDVYRVAMGTVGGCTITATDTIKTTSVSIAGISASSSCLNGSSGSAVVQPVGSNGTYSYTWTNVSTSSTVSTAQNAFNLAPGTYSVSVNSPGCGTATASVSVNVTPVSLAALNYTFCGSSAYIPKAGGSNYQWYSGSTLLTGPIGTNDTLYVGLPTNGDTYTLVYQNSTGCKDSIKYTLLEVPGGSLSFSNIQPACSGNNGSAVLNLSPSSPGPYRYVVTNASNSVITNTTIAAASYSIGLLATGGYTTVVLDGGCTYKSQFFIGNIQNSFTVVPTSTLACLADTSMFRLSFPSQSILQCAVGGPACTNVSTVTLFTGGPFTQNAATSYPTTYANWYKYTRTQFLIRKAELNAAGITAGKISSLSFKVLNLNNTSTVFPDFSISMACTSLSALPTSSGNVPFVSGLQPVYSSTNQAIALGWVTHQFSQAYNWDGQSNLIIEICSGLPLYSANASIELKQMPYIASSGTSRDFGVVCGSTATVTNNSFMPNGMYMLPNVRFGYCPSSLVSSNCVMSVSSNGTITQNYNNDSLRIVPTGSVTTGSQISYTITAIYPSIGCASTQTTAVTFANAPAITVNSGSVCSGQTFTMIPNGANTYTYSSGSNTVSPVSNSTYTVTGSGINGCVNSVGAISTVSVLAAPVLAAQNASVCVGTSTVLNISGANTYSWTTGAMTASISVSPTITTHYTVTGTSNNCSSTQTLAVTVNQACQDVWPGDANSDGTADNFDVLELGLHFTQTGPARATTSNTWQSWFANNWTGTITNGKNANHSDCNGDGTIDNSDTLAIFNNYGLTHAFKPTEPTATNPQLNIVPDQNAVAKGAWGTSSVFLGEASVPVTNINGLAFTVTFDENLIDANSFYIEYPVSFLNTGNQNLKFSKPDFANGKLYTANTHTMTNNVSGNGKIAVLHYKVKSNLATDEVLNVGITQAKQSNAAGTLTPLTVGAATIAAIGASVGMDELSNGNSVGMYPNPANSSVTIQSNTKLEKVELLSITGQIMLSEKGSGTHYQLDLANIANGVYMVYIYSADQKVTRKKLVVQR